MGGVCPIPKGLAVAMEVCLGGSLRWGERLNNATYVLCIRQHVSGEYHSGDIDACACADVLSTLRLLRRISSTQVE